MPDDKWTLMVRHWPEDGVRFRDYKLNRSAWAARGNGLIVAGMVAAWAWVFIFIFVHITPTSVPTAPTLLDADGRLTEFAKKNGASFHFIYCNGNSGEGPSDCNASLQFGDLMIDQDGDTPDEAVNNLIAHCKDGTQKIVTMRRMTYRKSGLN